MRPSIMSGLPTHLVREFNVGIVCIQGNLQAHLPVEPLRSRRYILWSPRNILVFSTLEQKQPGELTSFRHLYEMNSFAWSLWV